MPTNLKSLLNRSRSRNDLKSIKSSSTSTNSTPTPTVDSEGLPVCSGNGANLECQCCGNFSSEHSNSSYMKRDSSSRSLFSLPGIHSRTPESRPSSPTHGNSKSNPITPEHSTRNSGSIRKSETVLALSNYNSKGHGVKEKILSTSSSALNTLLQTSRSKLFGGFKLSNSQITPCASQSNCNTCAASEAVTNHSQISLCESTNAAGSAHLPPLTPMNRLRRNGSMTNTHYSPVLSISRSCSTSSIKSMAEEIVCRLCLSSIELEDTLKIEACSCRYCKDCVLEYVRFEIAEGAYEIACPDAKCESQGVLSLTEIQHIVSPQLLEKHKKFRLYKEVESDSQLMWCPSPGCETICKITESDTNGGSPKIPTIQCIRCQHIFCSECKLPTHPNLTCEFYRQKLIKQGKLTNIEEEPFAAYESIKKCPFCHVPIEKDSGCAQMMCKRCKHVFCWYCLSSLDDDFLLRHYDKGPCKNKLGHSRASVVWHRTQVIGIFAGFGLLVLLASPLLILAAPCLLCCRCRWCTEHLDTDDSPDLI